MGPLLNTVSLGLLLVAALPSAAFAQDTASAVGVVPQASADDVVKLRAEVARQGAAVQQVQERVALELRLSGYVQVDWILHNQASQNEVNYATGLPLNQDRFTLRRGHLRVTAERQYLSGALELDANTTNGAQMRPIDAEIAAHWPARRDADSRLPYFTVSAGLMKIPFGFEVPELDVERPFLERSSTARAFFPGEFDLGARFRAQYRALDLSIAVMNGHPTGDRVFPALAPDEKKEIVGHFGAHSELAPGVGVELGVSADTGTGFHEGTPTTKDQLVWRDDNGDGIVQTTEVQVIAGSSASPSQQYHRFALGADARVAIRFAPHAELALRGEVVRASNLDRGLEVADPVAAGHDLHELGWYLGATQEVSAWGLVGIRYDHYNPDQDASEQQAAQSVPRDRSYSTLALLGMFRYEQARLSLEYDHNRNSLGRDASGAPTTLKSDALTLRTQLRF
ncbi:MAG: hypothetical protein ABI488_04670 [Polyangiaceae bacterium]